MSPVNEIAAETLQVEALLLSRTYLYTLFHKLLGGAPSGELLEVLTGETTCDVLDEYADNSPALVGAAAFFKGLCKRGSWDAESFAREVTGEFNRLFVGPGRPEAFPLESPYRTGEATYFQENTVAVRGEYRRFGLEPKRAGHMPDDHVSLLCACMAELAERALGCLRSQDAAGLAASLRSQESFAAQHLSWLWDFAQAARRGKTARLYPQVVEALAEFVQVDRTFMGEAALWAENLEASGIGGAQDCTGFSPELVAEKPEAFARVERELERLRAIRLVGLEENELVTL